MKNIFTDKEAFRTIDRFRIIYLVAAILAFILTELGRFVYRPYIYNNDINDFGIADSMGNLGGIVVQLFLSLALLNSRKIQTIRVFAFIIGGYIIYEILQPFLPKGTFDWKDIYGTLIGGAFSFLIWWMIVSFVKNKVYFKFNL